MRLTIWGLIVIYGGSTPVSIVPRLVATISSLLVAYVLTVATLAVARHLVREADAVAA